MIWGGFSFSYSHAATVYESLDQSASLPLEATVFVGSFVSPSAGLIGGGLADILFAVKNDSASSATINAAAGPTFSISTSTSYVSSTIAGAAGADCKGATILSNETRLCRGPVTGVNGATNWELGTTYYVFLVDDQVTSGELNLVTDNSFQFYGFITDSGGLGNLWLPGEWYLGVSTTSTQQFCSTNFSTSSGFLDSLGQSISLGFCNVGSFLFVPSSSSLTQFYSLASSSQEKIPFSYYYGIRDVINGNSASSTQNFQTISLNLSSTGIGSTSPLGLSNIFPGDHELLSTTTIFTYISPTLYNLLMSLVVAAIWFAVALHIYRKLVPKHSTHV